LPVDSRRGVIDAGRVIRAGKRHGRRLPAVLGALLVLLAVAPAGASAAADFNVTITAAPTIAVPSDLVVFTALVKNVGDEPGYDANLLFTVNDDATLTDRRVWAELPGMGPDGCALDADGAIWMADAFGAGCVRIKEGGEVLETVVASQPVFACALGGADRTTLYMLTAPGFGQDKAAGKEQGRVEAVQVDAPGVGWP